MLKAIVFDFGNVVGFFDHHKTFAKLAPYTDWPAKRIYDEIYCGPLEDALESGQMPVDEFIECFIARTSLRCEGDYLRAACADIFTPNPEVCELIPRLKGRYRIILGSNTNPLHAVQFRRQFADVLAHFDAEVVSYEVGVRKPKAGFFEACVRHAGCEASQCLFIDDLAANIAGAEAVGLRGLIYKPGDNLAGHLTRHGVQLRS